MKRLELHHEHGRSLLVLGRDAIAEAAAELSGWVAGRTTFLVTSPTPQRYHEERIRPLLEGAQRVVTLEVPDGEEAKTVEHAAQLWRRMLEEGGKRDSRVVNLGGGTVGDLGGFVAGCFLRGVEVAQLPTTLLAQVDASVGGKTAVDLPEGKNTVGVFQDPAFVVADAAFLDTLPDADFRAGLFEVVKMAALLDAALLHLVDEQLDAILAKDPELVERIVVASVEAKARVVEEDPHEGGLRRVLNFGHTLGHALEAAAGYQGLRHGEAIGYGMLFALDLARERDLDARFASRLQGLIERIGLPPLPPVDQEAVISAMHRDKKALERGLVWVLPRGQGEWEFCAEVSRADVERRLPDFLRANAQGFRRAGP